MSQRGKTRVGVIFGGRSGEHEVSLRSAESIIRSLDPSKYEVVPIAITHEGRWLGSQGAMAMLSAGEAIQAALTRGEPTQDTESQWDPASGRLDRNAP